MKITIKFFFLIMATSLFGQVDQKKLHVMVISGGHDFDEAGFYGIFKEFKGISYEIATQPRANQRIEEGKLEGIDVLIFYDMFDYISEGQKMAYLKLLEKGTAMVFLHHSLVSYQDWPEFTNIIGGKFIHKGTKASTYEHDVPIDVIISNYNHPIVQGLGNWTILDETYGKCIISSKVKPLLETKNKNSLRYLGWTNAYGNSNIVYLQSGHGPSAYEDKNYLKLLEQAIRWSDKEHN